MRILFRKTIIWFIDISIKNRIKTREDCMKDRNPLFFYGQGL